MTDNPKYRRWSKDEDALLRRLKAEGRSWDEISAETGRTPAACRNRMGILKSDRPEELFRKAWNEEDDQTLLRLVEQGLSWPRIGMGMGRSRDATRNRYATLKTGYKRGTIRKPKPGENQEPIPVRIVNLAQYSRWVRRTYKHRILLPVDRDRVLV